MWFAILGVTSSVIFIFGDVPYAIDIFKGKTKPHRITWGMAALLNSIGFANQYASGARNSLWLFGAGALVTGFIFLLSFRSGVGGHTKLDIFSIAGCLFGLTLWGIFHQPLLSIFANLLVDTLSILPSYAKAKKDPKSETKISWLIGTFSVLLATISVGKLDWKLLILPGASFLLQCYMVYILYVETEQM